MHIVDESNPASFDLPKEAVDLLVECRNREIKTDESGILTRLARCASRSKIKRLTLGGTSALQTLDLINLFPCLEDLRIEIDAIEDFAPLARVSSLKRLAITCKKNKRRDLSVLPSLALESLQLEIARVEETRVIAACSQVRILALGAWPLPDLSQLPSGQLKDLRLSRAKCTSVGPSFRHPLHRAAFALCHQPLSLAGLRTPILSLDACKRVDFSTLPACVDLSRLQLFSMSSLNSLRWVARCPHLRHLGITATGQKACDLLSVANAPSLRTFWISPRRDADIIDLAAHAPHLCVCNGKTCLINNQPADIQTYYNNIEPLNFLPPLQ